MKNTYFENMTRNDFKNINKQLIAIIPVASIEQHGAHLPVSTDTIILEYVVKRAAEICKSEVVIAPIIKYGFSSHHFSFPGVFSLRGETLLKVLIDVGGSLIRTGFRKVLFLTGHGGNSHLAGQAAREMSSSHQDIIALSSSYWDISKNSLNKLVGDKTDWIPGHAGLVETSMVMAINYSLIDEHELQNYQGEQKKNDTILGKVLNNRSFFERSNYIGLINGVSDSPKKATPKFGFELLTSVVKDMGIFLDELYKHP